MKVRLILIAWMFILGSSYLRAGDLATIVGNVTDPTGAVIPGASITILNPAKGLTGRYVTNSAGAYTAANLPIGEYTVTAEAAGFQKLLRSGITLNADQTLRVDLTMRVGQTTQEITVHGNLPRVETENGTISTVITESQVSQLSIQARNFTNLALLVPGAAPLGGGFDPNTIGDFQTATLPINGVPGNMNNWEVDGTNNVDQGSGSDSLQVFPSLDSIAEFRILTSNYSAEYAKSGGGIIEVVTKSGTGQFHGSAFEFLRNDKLDANDWFINRTIAPPGGNAPKTPVKRNDWGFTLGGPVYIPGHYNTNKDKTFFFVSEEWRRHREGTVIDTGTPSVRMRGGDFSECDPASGNYNVVVASGCVLPVDPTTGNPFPNDIVPIDPVSKTLLDGLIPLPNNGLIHYTKPVSNPTNFREDMFRIDHNINDKTRIFFRYTQDAYEQVFVPTLWSAANFATVKSNASTPGKSAVLHLSQTFRPDLMNEVILSFSTDRNDITALPGIDSPSGTISRPADFGVKTIFPGNANQPLLPGVSVHGGNPFSFSEDTGYNINFWDPNLSLKDNVVWTHGRHILKTGFFLLRNQISNTVPLGGTPQGFLQFDSSSSLTTGNALADMYLGRIGDYYELGKTENGQLVGGFGLGHWKSWDVEPYVQDDWRVTPTLTLNLGLRYSYITPFHDYTEPSNESIFVPSQYSSANQAQLDAAGNIIQGTGDFWLNFGNGLNACGVGTIPKGCIKLPHNTFSPRFGFSWDPTGSGKTVFRGGYALVYDSSNSHFTSAGRGGNPPVTATLYGFNILGYGNVVPGALGPVSMLNLPLQQALPQIDQFSLGIQHEFPANTILGVSYVGTLGRHLQRARNLNQVPIGVGIQNVPALAGNPGCDVAGNCDVQSILINTTQAPIFFAPYRGYTSINQRESTGVSGYNSLQVNVRHDVGHGLMFQGIYTWSHTIDDLIGGGGGGSSNGVNDYDLKRWKGTSSLNQTHVLVLNYVYQLPFFAHSSSAFVRGSLGGWQVSGVTTFSTGPPIDLTCGISGMSSGVGGNVLCNSLGKVGVKKGVTNDPQFGPTPTWFDPGTIGQITIPQLRADNEPGMFGYMGKNPINGPGRNNWDIGLTKNFELPWFYSEHSTLQFRWETFNTFNHPQWSSVNLFCSGATLPGQPCNGPDNIGNGEVSGAHNPRIMQMGLRLVF